MLVTFLKFVDAPVQVSNISFVVVVFYPLLLSQNVYYFPFYVLSSVATETRLLHLTYEFEFFFFFFSPSVYAAFIFTNLGSPYLKVLYCLIFYQPLFMSALSSKFSAAANLYEILSCY